MRTVSDDEELLKHLTKCRTFSSIWNAEHLRALQNGRQGLKRRCMMRILINPTTVMGAGPSGRAV
jgi:hypothetical protein